VKDEEQISRHREVEERLAKAICRFSGVSKNAG